MHSFLSKVFGRKKDDKETSPTTLAPGELLEGRFEAVSPNVSPNATHFLELDPKTNGHNKDPFTFFKAKSRPASPELAKKLLDTLPHLSLNFSEFKERPLDPDLDVEGLLTDAVIGQRRLNPLEALVLIRACSQAIIARGLETLGLMHPHWYSSSPEIQRRLISHFLNSLAPQSASSPLSPTLSSPISAFESEINFIRDPHDVATVLRWGLRHLQLEGDHFGTDDGWYKAFLDAESAAEYPPKAFSEKLAPNLPPAHLELLIATLEIFSSLAAHSEANSTSGSKLSKIFGLWLLTARRVEDKDDWQSFYSRWERTGRMLEHLFLARIRDESTDQRMPVRLLELVRKYPYTQGLSSPTTDLQLLPRPRFTTSLYDALFVRVEFEYPTESRKPKLKIHPLNLLADAFSANIDSAEYAELWAKITAASKSGSDPSPLSNIFSDDTIRFLSLVSDGGKGKEKEVKSPTFSTPLLSPPTSPVKRSFSARDEPSTSTAAVEHEHHKVATDPASPISPLAIGSDWAQFSSSGFLDTTPAIAPLVSTLFDMDIEKTVPPDPPVQTLSRKSSKGAKRKSAEVPRAVAMADSFATQGSSGGVTESIESEDSGPIIKATNLEIIQFDEAFIDFWSDSLLDPITSKWPTFIICKFKSTLVPQLTYGKVEEGKPQKTLKWLILEQVYTVKAPTPPVPVAAPPVVDPEPTETARPSSPTGSTSGKKRFTFWSLSRSASTSSATSTSDKEKSKKKTPKISEMGELIEEDSGKSPSSLTKIRKSVDLGRRSVDQKRKPLDQAKKSSDQRPVTQQAVVEGSTTTTNAVVAAAAVAATGAAVLTAVPEDRPVEEEQVESQKAVGITDADVKVSALSISHPELLSEPVPTSATEVATIAAEPPSTEEIAKLEPAVSSPVLSKAEVIAPVIEEEKVVEAKEVGIVPVAIEEEKVGEAEGSKEEAVEQAVEAEPVKELGIVPATVEKKIGEAEATKEEADEKVVEDEAVKEVEIIPSTIEEGKVGEAQATKEEVVEQAVEAEPVKELGIVPATVEEKVGEAEATKDEADEKVVEDEALKEVKIAPSTIEEEKAGEAEATKKEAEEKVVEGEAVKEVEIVPAAIEEEKVAETKPTEEVEIIPAAVKEKAIDTELPKEELAVLEPVVSPFIPVVETEIPIEPEVVKEEISAAELVALPIVEAEEAHVVEEVAPVVEPSQEEVTIIEPIIEPPALEVEASPAAEGPIVEHPAPEETKAEDVETSAVAEPVSTIEKAVIPALAVEKIIETEAAEPLSVVQPTEPEAPEPAKLEDEVLIGNEDTQVNTEAVPSVEEVVEPVFIPVDSASEDGVVVEREEISESAPPVSETPLASGVEEEAIPALEHIQEISAAPLADVNPKEREISANMKADVEEDDEDVSVEGFSVVPVPEPTISNEEWEEVLAVSESEHATQVVQQQVEEVPVVPVPEITVSDEARVLVPESEPAVQVAEEKAEENIEVVEVVEAEIVPGQLTDDLAEAKEEDEAEQMKVGVAEVGVEEVTAKDVEAGPVEEIVEEAANEVEDKADEVEKANGVEKANEVEKVDKIEESDKVDMADKVEEADEVDKADKVEEEVDKVAQGLQSPVASVVISEAEQASEPVSTLEDFPKSDAVVVEEEKVTEHDFLVPQAPLEDTATPALAHDEEVFAPTEEVVSAIPTAQESTGNLQEESLEDISRKHVEEIAPVPSIEVITSNGEELLDAQSGAVFEIIEAKPQEPQEVVEETNAAVPVVVEAEDEKVDVVDENAEGGGIISEVEDTASGLTEAHVEVPTEAAEENVELEGERAEEAPAAGVILEDLVEETTSAVDENATGFALKTSVGAVEISGEKGVEPVAAIEEETASALPSTVEEPVHASSEFMKENVEDSVVIEENVVLDRARSESALDLFPNEAVEDTTARATEAVEEKSEELMTAVTEDVGASLTDPESVEEVEQKVEQVVEVEDVAAKFESENELPFATAREVIKEKGGVLAEKVEEERVTIPVFASEVLLETSLDESAALQEKIFASSSAPEPEATNEAEAGSVELFDQKEEEGIVEVLAPEHAEETSVDSIVPVEEKEFAAHIPEQEPGDEEVERADEGTMILEMIPASSVPVGAVEIVEVIEENAGQHALVIEDEAEPRPAAISEVDLGVSSEAVEENSGDGTQVIEEQTVLNPEHTAGPTAEAVEEVVEADDEEPAAHIEAQEAVVISESDPLAGAEDDVNAVEEVVPSSEDAIVRQTAEEPITALAEIEVAPIPTSAYENVEEKQANGIDQATQAELVPSHLDAIVEQDVEMGQKGEPVAEAQLEQHTATDQGVVEAVSLIEADLAPGPVAAPEVAADLTEQGLDMATPTVEETMGSVPLDTEHVPASEIPVEPVFATAENDEEEPNAATEEEFPVPASESPLATVKTVRGVDHQVEEKTIVVDEAELRPHPESSEEPIASIPSPESREANPSPKAVDPTFESKDALDTPAVLETLVGLEPVEVMPVLQPTPPALEATFEEGKLDQHADTVEASKFPLTREPDAPPTALAEKVASHYVPSDSKEAPIFDSCVETDEQTEKAPKTSKEVLPVDLDAKVSAETPLVGPLEDANLGMSSGRLDNAAAAKEDSPMISALAAENDPVEDAATHGEYPSVVQEHVDHFSAVPIADALEPKVEDGLSEMESRRDVIDDSVPVVEAGQLLEAPIAHVEELTPLSETPVLVAEPILTASDSPAHEVPAVDGKQEESILVKNTSEVLPTPVDIELKTEISAPTAVDSVDNQNTTLEAATGVVSHKPSSLTEPPVVNEINLPTLVEGISAATLAESASVSKEQERAIEVKDVEPDAPVPVLEGQTTELAVVEVDGVRERPPAIEEPSAANEEILATDSFPDIVDGTGNKDVAPSQELVPDIQFATPTPIPEVELAVTSEELTPLPAVEPVLALASPVIENLTVPEAKEFISLDTVEEVKAAGDEDSKPISEELVAKAEADAPSVDPVIPAPDIAAVRDSETVDTPAEQPSGTENLFSIFSTEAEAEIVEVPASPREPIAEIDEPASLQVEESQIAELEPVLVDSSPIEAQLKEPVTQKSSAIEAENVESVPNAPSCEEPVAAEDAPVEDSNALVQDVFVEDAQHEESTLVRDVQGAVVSEPNFVEDSDALESQELVGAEESDTGPIEEDSAPVTENQLVDKSVPSNENVVEHSKAEVEEPIVIDASITEDSPVVVETPLEATVSVVDDAPSFVDEPELPAADVDIAKDFGTAPELTGESEIGGGIDLTISEVLEVPKAPEFANDPAEVETLDSVVDKPSETEVMTELSDATANEHDTSKELEADINPTSDTTPSLIEIAPEELDTSFDGPVAAGDSLVTDAQNVELINQELIPVRSVQEEIASEPNVMDGSGALMSQESIAATEESDAGPIAKEDSAPVTESYPVGETTLPIENVVEESTIKLEDPMADPEPTVEESPAIVETALESNMPIVEAPSVVDKPESLAAHADVFDRAALVAEDSTDATKLIGESEALTTSRENDLTTSTEVPKAPEAETLASNSDVEGVDVAAGAVNAPEVEVTEILDATTNEHHDSKDLEADPNRAGETAPVEITEESTIDKLTQIELSSELLLLSPETSDVVADQPTSSAAEDLEAEESPMLETVVTEDSTMVEAQLAKEIPPAAFEKPTQDAQDAQGESSSKASDAAPTPADSSSANAVDAEVHVDLEEKPTTATTEGTEISPTPIPVSEGSTTAEADSFAPPNETLIENIQVEEGLIPVTESTVAESIAPAAEEESTTANPQESMEVADVLTDSLHVREPIVIQQHEPSNLDALIPVNNVIGDVLTKNLVADAKEALPITTSQIDSGAASVPDVEADIVPPALEVAAEVDPVEDRIFEPEITPMIDSAPLEPPFVEETSEAIPVDEAITTTRPSSALIIDDLPSGATATEEPVFSDNILDDFSDPTEVEGTALEEPSAPTSIEEPTPTEHLTDSILDATTIAHEPIAIADVESIKVKDELCAIEFPVVVDSAIAEVDPLAEEQTTVEGEPTFTMPSVESAASENSPALEETTTVIDPASDNVIDSGQNEAPLLESQIIMDNDAEAPAKLAPLDTHELQDSKSVVEDNVEDDVPVVGPVPVVEAAPANDSVPLGIDDLASTPTASEESTHIEGTSEPLVQEGLIAATEIAPSSTVVEDRPVETYASEHITEGPVANEPVAPESLETAEDENVVEISAPNDLDPILPVYVEGFTLQEPTVSENLFIVEDTTATEVLPTSSIVVVEDGPLETSATEHVAEEPAAEITETLEPSPPEGGNVAAELSAPTEEAVTAAEPNPITPTHEALADNPNSSLVVVDEDVALIDVEGSALHEPTIPEDLPIVEDTAAKGVVPPSSIVVEDGPVEANVADIAEEPTESLETTIAEGPVEDFAPTEEVVTAAEPDPTIPIHEALIDNPEPSPVAVNKDVAPVDVEKFTPHEPTAPADPLIEDTTATEIAPLSSIVAVEDAAEHSAEEPVVEPTVGLGINTAEGENVDAEISAPLEFITASEPDPTIPIHDNLADSQDPSPIVVDEDIAPVDVEGSTPHEPTAPEDLPVVQDTTTTEVVTPSNIVEDGPVETNATEHIAPESEVVEPAEGENVVAEISAPIKDVTAAAELDPTPVHEDLIENQDSLPPIVVHENVTPVNVEESASLEPTPAAVENDLAEFLDVSSNTEATALVSAPEPNIKSAEAEPIKGKLEIDEVVPDDLPTQKEEDLTAVPALDNSDTDISSQEFEDIILELETAAAAEVSVSDGNGHLASSDVGDGSTALEDDKPVDLDQEILGADDTVAAAEVAAEVEILAGNGHSELSAETPISNGHGHKIDDEVLEVSKPEVQLDSNSDNIQAEVSIGNGHDSKIQDDVLHTPEVAELPPPTSAEADATPAIEN